MTREHQNEDLRLLRDAKAKEGDVPCISLEELKQRLAKAKPVQYRASRRPKAKQ